MAALKPGAKAPAFSLPDKDGVKHALKDVKTEFTVIYFYPRDNTPGCTIEAKAFSKDIAKFDKAGATVIGISGGNEKSKTKFCDKYKLKVTLLSDEDHAVCKKYGVFGRKKFMGREFDGIFRHTLVLDKNKKVIQHYDKVSPAAHPGEILDFLKGYAKG